MSIAVIVASLHARTGKTLLARMLAEYFILSGRRPLLFDTDVAEARLSASFPHETMVVDPTHVPDQMTLFDTLALTAPEARVVDVSHQGYRKFVRLMHDIGFVAEAHAHDVEPVIFFIADRNADSYEEALSLRERSGGCPVVAVENGIMGRPPEPVRTSSAYQTFVKHELHLTMPVLDPAAVLALAEPQFSVSGFMRAPHGLNDVPLAPQSSLLDARGPLRSWVLKLFQDIHRLSRAVNENARPVAARRVG
jgi:hypothetical protein